ncbi:ABC transporter permease [Dictyobacter arantiisoli]|uniref:FHA domain-containing protein n=1 Tax=Dictyobacter arantiisoli TaxID=2014874 RepID=A0A5A5TB37_9CHLR|nr:FtsX-like permease family protein [Dictyobacter arantiisoli]GCF08642.1 hypothetical protein KDI_22060 [Dictyobacter arantiisoli]
MRASLKKPLADILQRKGRTLLVVLAIFIGVFGLTCIHMTKDTLFSAFAFSMSSQINQPDIVLAVDRLDSALLPVLQSVPNVKALQYETTFETLWHIERSPGYTSIQIISYPDLHHASLPPFELVSGRYPQPGEIVLEYGDKGIQNVQIGDQISVDTSLGSAQLRVVGFARTPGINPAVSDKAQGYMSDNGIQHLAAFATLDHPDRPTRLHSIVVKVTTIREVNATAHALQQQLNSHQIKVQLTAFPDATILPLQQFDGIFALLEILVWVAMGISALLVFTTVTTIITEHIAIIGTMKALGGTGGRIMQSYLFMVGIYCLLATIPGLLLGIGGGFLLASLIATSVPLSPGPFSLPPEIIPFALAVGCGVPLLAALLPLCNGMRMTVREALSGYGIRVETVPQRGLLARFHLHPAWPSQTLWLGLRSLFRKRWRLMLILLTLSSAGTSFLIVQIVTTSINDTVGSAYSRLDADVEVDLENASFSKMHAQLQALSNVQRIERYGTSGANTTWGRIVLSGFDPDTHLYRYQLTSGRWLRSDDTNAVLLSDDFAARSGLHSGNTLTLTGQNNQSATWTVVGTLRQAVDSMGQVGAAVLPVDTLYRFMGIPENKVSDTAMRLLLHTQNHSQAALNQLTTQIGKLALGSVINNESAKSGTIVNVFLLQNEIIRHQRSWFGIYGLLYGVAAMIGLAGILCLAKELTNSVLERQREIGILRSMGASSWRIMQVFWIQGLVLGGLAWLFAALSGLPLAYGFVRLFSSLVLPTTFIGDPLALLMMLISILFIASVACLFPALHASRMRIATMLRYE